MLLQVCNNVSGFFATLREREGGSGEPSGHGHGNIWALTGLVDAGRMLNARFLRPDSEAAQAGPLLSQERRRHVDAGINDQKLVCAASDGESDSDLLHFWTMFSFKGNFMDMAASLEMYGWRGEVCEPFDRAVKGCHSSDVMEKP